MNGTQQPEALRFAEMLDKYSLNPLREASAELRHQHARIAELEAQLSAIGAGGVEPLRQQVERKAAAPQPPEEAPVQLPDGTYPLEDFKEGQWWVVELDKIANLSYGSAVIVTADMKRAVAVVHHMLRSASYTTQQVRALLTGVSAPVAQAGPAYMEVLLDAISHLAGAASAYRTYAKRAPHLGKVPADAFFTTRVADMDKAVDRAHVALEYLRAVLDATQAHNKKGIEQ